MKRLIVLLIAVCTVCGLVVSVSATKAKIPGIITQFLSEERKKSAEQNLKLELLDNDNYKVGISSFDVSKDGLIALAIKHGIIYVYDAEGNFLYGYRFRTQGAYGVVFCGENVAIYLVRGNVLMIYDPEGNCIDAQEIIYPDNPDLYQIESKQYAGKNYRLQRNVGFTDTYARLEITDAEGNQNVIYDISVQHSISTVLFIVGFIGFFALVITGTIKQVKEYDSREGIWYCRELKMQISIDDPRNAFFMDNGERIRCRCDMYFNGGTMEVLCQELEHPKYAYGKTIFVAEIKHYEDMSMVVFDRKTWQKYTFVRTDKIG